MGHREIKLWGTKASVLVFYVKAEGLMAYPGSLLITKIGGFDSFYNMIFPK